MKRVLRNTLAVLAVCAFVGSGSQACCVPNYAKPVYGPAYYSIDSVLQTLKKEVMKTAVGIKAELDALSHRTINLKSSFMFALSQDPEAVITKVLDIFKRTAEENGIQVDHGFYARVRELVRLMFACDRESIIAKVLEITEYLAEKDGTPVDDAFYTRLGALLHEAFELYDEAQDTCFDHQKELVFKVMGLYGSLYGLFCKHFCKDKKELVVLKKMLSSFVDAICKELSDEDPLSNSFGAWNPFK